jgi:hypothetical protein
VLGHGLRDAGVAGKPRFGEADAAGLRALLDPVARAAA